MNPGLLLVPPGFAAGIELIDRQLINSPRQHVQFNIPDSSEVFEYYVAIDDVRSTVSPAALASYMAINGGPPIAAASSYAVTKLGYGSSSVSQNAGSTGTTTISFDGAGNTYTLGPPNGAHVKIHYPNLQQVGSYKRCMFSAMYEGATDASVIQGVGIGVSAPLVAGKVTALLYEFTAGQIAAGDFRLYRVPRFAYM